MKLLAATAMSLSLLVSTGAFAGQALAAEADKKSQLISRAGSPGFRQRACRIFYRQCPYRPFFSCK